MRTLAPPEQPIAVHGQIAVAGFDIEYQLTQPAPTQWVALGLVRAAPQYGAPAPRLMLVGRGATATQATADLAGRVRRLAGAPRPESPPSCLRHDETVLVSSDR